MVGMKNPSTREVDQTSTVTVGPGEGTEEATMVGVAVDVVITTKQLGV